MRVAIVMLLVATVKPALGADIYQCVDANGTPRFTNIQAAVTGCKRLNLPPNSLATDPLPQAEAATPSAREEAAGLPAAAQEPDPVKRLQALDDWAHGARDNLNPVTYALVDPDEFVRARAQELWKDVFKH